jgi:hypothetical protein
MQQEFQEHNKNNMKNKSLTAKYELIMRTIMTCCNNLPVFFLFFYFNLHI